MQDEMLMYVRNRKKTPIGVTYFKRTGLDIEDTEIIVTGWSKACASDTFTKKRGRTIAGTRALKANKWVMNAVRNNIELDGNIIEIGTDEYVAHTGNIPFVIKENLEYYLDAAKEGLGIEGKAIFVVPVIETFVDLSSTLMEMLTGSDGSVDASKPTTKTRYITVLY